MMNRRAFLTGIVAAAAAVPVTVKALASGGIVTPPFKPLWPYIGENPCKVVVLPDTHFADPKLFLYEKQWKRFAEAGIDMRNCVLVTIGSVTWRSEAPNCASEPTNPTSKIAATP